VKVEPDGALKLPARGLELVSLYVTRLAIHLFESPFPAILPAAAGLWFARRLGALDRYLLVASAVPLGAYWAYWHDGYYLGPRFVFPLLPLMVIWSARLPSTLAAMRLQAQIDRQIEQYQKRPRKKFIGASAAEYRFAQYEEDWRVKIERVGTLNYPAEARGKLYGNLRLTVIIRPDGNVESIELDRSSGLKVLDAAAFKIVRMATPFAAFPPDIRRDTDLLIITRTWFFGQGDKIWTE
jgi:TonB family protein